MENRRVVNQKDRNELRAFSTAPLSLVCPTAPLTPLFFIFRNLREKQSPIMPPAKPIGTTTIDVKENLAYAPPATVICAIHQIEAHIPIIAPEIHVWLTSNKPLVQEINNTLMLRPDNDNKANVLADTSGP